MTTAYNTSNDDEGYTNTLSTNKKSTHTKITANTDADADAYADADADAITEMPACHLFF